jgi:DNA primase
MPAYDYAKIKASVSVLDVVKHYGWPLKQVNQHQWKTTCRLPCHGNKEPSPDSFSIGYTDSGKQVWRCFSPTCTENRKKLKAEGNVFGLVMAMEGCTLWEAAKRLTEWSGTELVNPQNGDCKPPAAIEPEEQATENKPLDWAFDAKSVQYHSYLEERGFSPEVCQHFGVGAYVGKGKTMAGRVVFPVRSPSGQLMAYLGRALGNVEPRWYQPNGFHKSFELFGIDKVQQCRAVILVESPWSVMRLAQAGFPSVALMGCSMSQAQAALLTPFNRVTVMLDGDKAGQDATPAIVQALITSRYVRVVQLPAERQPDSYSTSELKALLEF